MASNEQLQSKPKLKKKLTCKEVCFYDLKVRVLMLLFLCGIGGLVIPILLSKQPQQDECMKVQHNRRFDCLPYLPLDAQTQEICNENNCWWCNATSTCFREKDCWWCNASSACSYINHCWWCNTSSACFHKSETTWNHYYIESQNETEDVLEFRPRGTTGLHFTNKYFPPALKLKVQYKKWEDYHLQIQIYNANDSSDEDASSYVSYNVHNAANSTSKNPLYEERRGKQNDPFYLDVRRKNRMDKKLFHTGPLTFSENFIEVTIELPSTYMYGLGSEVNRSTFKHDFSQPRKWALQNKYNTNPDRTMDYVSSGAHPFYLVMDGDNKNFSYAHGVLLLNSHSMEIATNSLPSVTFRITGGRLNFHLFFGPTPLEVIQQLTNFIGKPSLPPYWAFGYHLCHTMSKENVQPLDRSGAENTPIESECRSVERSEMFMFNRDQATYYTSSDFNESIVNVQRDSVTEENLIIFQSPHYAPIENWKSESNQVKLFSYGDNEPYEGKIDDTKVYYPDYWSGVTIEWLKTKYKDYLQNVTFSGLILDLNTPLNTGVMCMQDHRKYFHIDNKRSDEGSICFNGTNAEGVAQYKLHNLYGYHHMRAVQKALEEIDRFKTKRLFLVSLSTFTGSGAFGGHLGTKIPSTWGMLKASIVQMLEFSMYGMPLFGMVSCGTVASPDANESEKQELCSRWLQLSAFQPLMMSYRITNDSKLDPLELGGRALYVAKATIQLRYNLLPYLYTLFYNSKKTGLPVIRSLFMEFPEDRKAYAIDEQFLWGKALMISPVVRRSETQIRVYFPHRSIWYEFYTGKIVSSNNNDAGKFVDLSALENQLNIHIRGGQIVVSQKAANTTSESRMTGLNITVALDYTKMVAEDEQLDQIIAEGELYVDDGESVNVKCYLHAQFTMTKNFILKTKTTKNCTETNDINYDFKTNTTVDNIRIFGLLEKPDYIKLVINKQHDVNVDFEYNDKYGSIHTKNITMDLLSEYEYEIQLQYQYT